MSHTAAAGRGRHGGQRGNLTPDVPPADPLVPDAPPADPPAPDTPPADPPAPEATCTEHYVTKIKGSDGKPADKDNICQKPAGHDGPHGRVRVVITPVAMTVLDSYETVGEDEKVEYGAGGSLADRSEEQKRMDALVKDKWESWRVAGKPQRFNDCPRGRFFISPDDEKAVRSMLRSAATFNSCKIRIAPLQKHTSGKHMIVWAAVDKPKEETPKPPQTGSVAEQLAALKSVAEQMGLTPEQVTQILDSTKPAPAEGEQGEGEPKLEDSGDEVKTEEPATV